MKLAAPRSIRDTVNAFLQYEDELGINSVLDRIDWRGVLPHQVYYATLARIPESRTAATPAPDFLAYELFHNALHSREFQQSIIALLLRAFEEKRRLIFIHIAKCAGVDLTTSLCERFPYLHSGLAEPEWTSHRALFAYIRDFAREAINADSIFVGGHLNLISMLERYRFGDELFTVVRDPISRVLSMINYVLGVMKDDSDLVRPDRLGWIDMLGYDKLPEKPSRALIVELARGILRNQTIVTPNAMCEALGFGDAASATDAVIRSNIEITDVARYGDWVRARWGRQRSGRLNSSSSVFRREDLSKDDMDYIHATFAEDFTLYDLIMRALNATSAPSITGVELDRALFAAAAPCETAA